MLQCSLVKKILFSTQNNLKSFNNFSKSLYKILRIHNFFDKFLNSIFIAKENFDADY